MTSFPITSRPPSRAAIWRRAWPIILANSAVPLLGLADTAVIGNFGDLPALGAIAFGALIFSFIYWSFGFLRMGTTGFTAQAAGSGDEAEVRATLARALLIASVSGLALIALQWPLRVVALKLLGGSGDVEALTATYFSIRIWGAPAVLCIYALMGTLIGLGLSRELLWTQLFLNGVNISLDFLFAGMLGWGAAGIALGTCIAEWSTLLFAMVLLQRVLRRRTQDQLPLWDWPRIIDREKIIHTLSANADILARTLLLLFAFAWFTNQGAIYGDAVLGANHVLLQFVAFSAFFLDGYAFVAESLVGEAIGGKQRKNLALAVRYSTELAAATALLLALLIAIMGDWLIAHLIALEPVRGAAADALPWAALYVLFSFAAFQLDGIFIGATRTRQMRNAAIVSTAVFLLAWWLLALRFGNHGLWWAFIIYVIARAVALAVHYPALARSVKEYSHT